MWFRKRKARDTHADLAQASDSLAAARTARAEQERKREQEQHVIRRIDRLKERDPDNIAGLIRRALLQQPPRREAR